MIASAAPSANGGYLCAADTAIGYLPVQDGPGEKGDDEAGQQDDKGENDDQAPPLARPPPGMRRPRLGSFIGLLVCIEIKCALIDPHLLQRGLRDIQRTAQIRSAGLALPICAVPGRDINVAMVVSPEVGRCPRVACRRANRGASRQAWKTAAGKSFRLVLSSTAMVTTMPAEVRRESIDIAREVRRVGPPR